MCVVCLFDLDRTTMPTMNHKLRFAIEGDDAGCDRHAITTGVSLATVGKRKSTLSLSPADELQ